MDWYVENNVPIISKLARISTTNQYGFAQNNLNTEGLDQAYRHPKLAD
jgi:hypothetical protein